MKIENKDGIVICSNCKYSIENGVCGWYTDSYGNCDDFNKFSKYCNRYPEKNIIDTITGEITYTQECVAMNDGHCTDYKESEKKKEVSKEWNKLKLTQTGWWQKIFN